MGDEDLNVMAGIAAFVARVSMILSPILVFGFFFSLFGFKKLDFPFNLLPGFLCGSLGFYLSSLIEIRPAQSKRKVEDRK